MVISKKTHRKKKSTRPSRKVKPPRARLKPMRKRDSKTGQFKSSGADTPKKPKLTEEEQIQKDVAQANKQLRKRTKKGEWPAIKQTLKQNVPPLKPVDAPDDLSKGQGIAEQIRIFRRAADARTIGIPTDVQRELAILGDVEAQGVVEAYENYIDGLEEKHNYQDIDQAKLDKLKTEENEENGKEQN